MSESAPPPRGYVICTEPRSGSTFLRRIFESTGVLGRPREFFGQPAGRIAIGRDPAGALADLVERASTANGVYGLKIFSAQFDLIRASGWAERLPNLHFVHLERRDLLGQAISLVRALQTNQFVSTEAGRAAPSFDARALSARLADLARNQARWRHYFARNAIVPLSLVYEDVVADPRGAAAALAAHLGLTEKISVDLTGIELAVQRDALSDEWRRRFLEAMGDRAYLDDWWLGKVRRRLRQARAAIERRRGR